MGSTSRARPAGLGVAPRAGPGAARRRRARGRRRLPVSTYAAAWRPRAELAERWVQVRVPGATHMAKHTRGLVARDLCQVGADARTPRRWREVVGRRFEVELAPRHGRAGALGPRREPREHRGCLDLVERVAPVVVFLVAITVVAEICRPGGGLRRRRPLGRARRAAPVLVLWLLIVAARGGVHDRAQPRHDGGAADPGGDRRGPAGRPGAAAFAMTTLWLANTASLLLPVSNLTNLLALHPFARWASARRATCGSRCGRPLACDRGHRRRARGCCTGATCAAATTTPRGRAARPRAARWSPAGCAWRSAPPSSSGSRRPGRRRRGRGAARRVLGTGGPRAAARGPGAVADGPRHRASSSSSSTSPLGAGWGTLLASVVSAPARRPRDLLRLSGVGRRVANAVNNLPAYLALEPTAADSPAAARGPARRGQRRARSSRCGARWRRCSGAQRCRSGRADGRRRPLARHGRSCARWPSVGAAAPTLAWLTT